MPSVVGVGAKRDCRCVASWPYQAATSYAKQISVAEPFQSSRGCCWKKQIKIIIMGLRVLKEWHAPQACLSWLQLASPAALRSPLDTHPVKALPLQGAGRTGRQQQGILQLPGEILLYNVQTITRNILSNCFCWRAIWASEHSWKLKSSPLILALVWGITEPAVYFKLLLEMHKLFTDESSSINTLIFVNCISASV